MERTEELPGTMVLTKMIGRNVFFRAMVVSLATVTFLGFSVTVVPSPRAKPLLRAADVQLPQVSEDGWKPIHIFYGNSSALLESADTDKKWFSQVHQDEIVMDILGPDGYFIDLAANDAKEFSNTLALEGHGWNGLCVEPNHAYWYGLSHRKCTVVGALVGDQIERVNVSFRGTFGGIVGLMNNQIADRLKIPRAQTEARFTAPLPEVFERFHVPKVVDYMSLDVEGAEYLIMKHFPFDQYQMKLMTVERPNEELKNLLAQHGYLYLKLVAKWGETLWAHNSTGLTPEHPKVAKIVTAPEK
jgi:hypothetical protein